MIKNLMVEKNQALEAEKAKEILMSALNGARRGIQASRVFAQRVGLKLPREDQLLLSKTMQEEWKKCGLEDWGGVLFQLTDTTIHLDHSAKGFIDEKGETKAIRGFNIILVKEKMGFDCFIMDHGGSRSYYDHKSFVEKVEFFKNGMEFVQQTHPRPDVIQYCSLISDNGVSYTINQFAPYRL